MQILVSIGAVWFRVDINDAPTAPAVAYSTNYMYWPYVVELVYGYDVRFKNNRCSSRSKHHTARLVEFIERRSYTPASKARTVQSRCRSALTELI